MLSGVGGVWHMADGCVVKCYEVLGSVRHMADGCVVKCHEVLGVCYL